MSRCGPRTIVKKASGDEWTSQEIANLAVRRNLAFDYSNQKRDRLLFGTEEEAKRLIAAVPDVGLILTTVAYADRWD